MQRHYAPAGMTTKEFYFNHVVGLSNSGLGKVQDKMEGNFDKPVPYGAFRFGSMVDAILTQPDELVTDLTDDELRQGLRLSEAVKTNPLAKVLLDHAEPQVIVSRTLTINLEGIEKEVLAKCMLDLALLKMGIGADIKTTAARTHAQFLASVERFNYDRQAYWYMETPELNKFVFIGISKTKVGEVFIHIVKRDDPMFLSGKEKAHALAYYHDLI